MTKTSTSSTTTTSSPLEQARDHALELSLRTQLSNEYKVQYLRLVLDIDHALYQREQQKRWDERGAKEINVGDTTPSGKTVTAMAKPSTKKKKVKR
jgi:hypothetical protein